MQDEVIFTQGNYEETVRDSIGDVRLVECSEFGIVKLWRIEYKDSLGHDQHKVAYLFDTAMALYDEACTRQEQQEKPETYQAKATMQAAKDSQHKQMKNSSPIAVRWVNGRRVVIRNTNTHTYRTSEYIPKHRYHSFTDQNGLQVHDGAVYSFDEQGELYEIEPLVPFKPSEY